MYNTTIRIIASLLICCSVQLSKAQTTTGTFSLGGTLSMSASKNRDNGSESNTTSYSFGPALGYFFADNLMAGTEFIMWIHKNEGTDYFDKRTIVALGPFLRYYKFTGNEQFAFYGEFGFTFGAGRLTQSGADPIKSRSFSMYLAPGFTWFPTRHWGVDFQVNLLSFNSEDSDDDVDGDNYNSFNFGLSTLAPSLGIRYYF